MADGRVRGRGGLAVLAAGGMALTHELSYRLASRGHHDHGDLMASTGHRHWTAVLAVALAAAVAVLAGVAVRWSARHHAAPRWWPLAWRLALLQSLAWVGVEFAERALVAGDASALAGETLFWFGLAAQLLTAAAGALILRLVVEVARRIAAAGPLRTAGAAPALAIPHVVTLPAARLVLTGGGGERSPPGSALALS